ncbi:MAG: HU family DNA-binding protein [Proteobacteria bacterium]|nr:HU family DNA-binding protein [Pseudomonadota bacterium]
MNKNELIADVISRSGADNKAEVGRIVDAMLDAITNSLSNGEEVRIVGFGTFLVSNRAATTGRNPRTGEPIKIPASKQARFKAGAALKSAVNK